MAVVELLEPGYAEDEIVRIFVDNGEDQASARQIVDFEVGRNAGDRVELAAKARPSS